MGGLVKPNINMEMFGKFCFGALAMIISAMIGGYAFMKFWEWFVVYSFNVHTLTLLQSIGLMFFIGYLKPIKKEEDMTFEKFVTKIVEAIIFVLISLGFGLLITLFQ